MNKLGFFLIKCTWDNPADGGSSPTDTRYDDKAKAFILQPRDAHIVGVTLPVSFCKNMC